MQCLEEDLNRFPCTRKYKNIPLDIIRGITDGSIDALCSGYDDTSDKCAQLPPLASTASPKSKHKYQSVAFVLVDLIDSL